MAVPRGTYQINLDDKYGKSTLIDIPGEVAACTDPWFNQTLTTVNDSAVRLGVVQGEYHWHTHELEDEFFLVLNGELLLDIEGAATVTLSPQQGYTVPRGVRHRPRAPVKTVILMIESAAIQPTGD